MFYQSNISAIKPGQTTTNFFDKNDKKLQLYVTNAN